jgi:two-component sensor histidine kinase
MNPFAASPHDLYITGELARRHAPPIDFLIEKQAIQELASRMGQQPEAVLPRFVELAMQLTGSVSAGLSLFEPYPSPGVFRWRYLRGSLAAFENATTPRDFSPCGITLDRKGPVLSLHPERFYDWIAEANIVVPEVLLVPFYLGSAEPMGTLWIVAEHEGHFQAEHARIATELASFVGIALKMLRTEKRLQAALKQQEMLTEEMSHRVKNLFAVSDAIVRMALKTASSKEDLAQVLTGRFHALASAHGLIRRSFRPQDAQPTVANLGELVHAVLQAHDRAAAGPSRFVITGPSFPCGELALNGIALVIHELATNALKYGALSCDEGRIDIHWTIDDGTALFIWREHGGPALSEPPQFSGFGSRLLRDTVEVQFRGALSRFWNSEGLQIHIQIPLERLSQ